MVTCHRDFFDLALEAKSPVLSSCYPHHHQRLGRRVWCFSADNWSEPVPFA
jgi:hypothetical protein